MNEDLWDALAASFGPVLRKAFPDAAPVYRMRVCEALRSEVRKREAWFTRDNGSRPEGEDAKRSGGLSAKHGRVVPRKRQSPNPTPQHHDKEDI